MKTHGEQGRLTEFICTRPRSYFGAFGVESFEFDMYFIYLFIYLYTVKNSSGTINSKKCLEILKSKILILLLQ